MGVAERRERERARRKSQILGAARTLLFSKGLNGATIGQIAKLAEVSVATIYSYYKNRAEIIADLSEEGFGLIVFAIEEAISSGGPPDEKLQRAAMAYLAFSTDHKEYFSVLNHFLTTPKTVLEPALRKRTHRQAEKILQAVEAVVEEGVNAGIFRTDHPRRFALMFWGSLNGIIHLKKFKGTLLSKNDYTALYRHTVSCMIRSLQ
ncbi:MAG: TetR/AcrR family transcriptional regulator [Desulfobacterales bacterium]|nr:TetR/AcrR family transcriptional regulator [Desulfobacterales bacterium]